MPKSSSKKQAKQEQSIDVASSNKIVESTPALDSTQTVQVHPKQIKCLMIGVATLIVINLILTVVAVVLGLQMNGEMEIMQENMEPIMELAETLDSMNLDSLNSGGGSGISGGGNMPTP